jgi:hypothetical protein
VNDQPQKEPLACCGATELKAGAEAGCAACQEAYIKQVEAGMEATAPKKMTINDFKKSGMRGMLYIPASQRRKKVERHPGESVAQMMSRIARGG